MNALGFRVGDRVVYAGAGYATGPGTLVADTPAGWVIDWDDLSDKGLVYSGPISHLYLWKGADFES